VDMAAEGCFEIVAAERQEQMAQGVHRRSTPETGAEDGVQALALQGDEGGDRLVSAASKKANGTRRPHKAGRSPPYSRCLSPPPLTLRLPRQN